MAYGEYLTKGKHYEEAGLAYMKAEEYELALEAFQTCLNWRQAVCVACKLQLPKDRMYSIARSMAGERLC